MFNVALVYLVNRLSLHRIERDIRQTVLSDNGLFPFGANEISALFLFLPCDRVFRAIAVRVSNGRNTNDDGHQGTRATLHDISRFSVCICTRQRLYIEMSNCRKSNI